MTVLRGVPAAPGQALAPPATLEPSAAGEIGGDVSLDEAAAEATRQLEALAVRLRERGREEESGILDAQAMLATDPMLLDAARASAESGEPADAAIVAAGEEAARTLAALDDELLAARAADVRDVAARIARILRGEAPPRLERRSVVVAADLSPSMTAEFDLDLLAGIALEGGSRTSHAAILSRALGIPAVVGVAGLLAAASGATEIAVDGDSGEVDLAPDDARRAAVAAWESGRAERREADRRLVGEPLATADGHRIMLGANIGRPEEAAAAVEAGAEGVGLFRTEFVFLDRQSAPDLATQRDAYAAALRAFGGRPVVIRLLDVGGDKPLPYVPMPPEPNPFLGVRAIRLAAEHPDLLVTQLRAILEAAVAAGVREPHIMAPMVADLRDVRMLHELLARAMSQTDAPDLAPCVGIMIEIPSATVVADQLAPEVAFFSIGTNDLTQYLLAADRSNGALADRQDPMHPAVLRAVRQVVEAARPHAVPVAVCGEMAGDAVGALTLVGLGVDELSMDPVSFTAVKRAVGSLSLADAQALARHCLDAPDAATARGWVTEAIGRAAS